MELISRVSAIGTVCQTECGIYCGHDCDVITAIKHLPTIDLKKGKWKIAYLPHEYMGCAPMAYYCSECNHITTFRTFYCPNCGADMRGEGNENQNN